VIEFTKMHGLGNDFIVIDNRDGGLAADYLSGIAPVLCRRHFGIGADGLAVLSSSSQAPFRMQIFNADGSEAEMCGNAIRCLARYVWDRGFIKEQTFAFETAAGIKEINLLIRGREVEAVRVEMGSPILESDKIPLRGPSRRAVDEKIRLGNEELLFTAVSMGNPHCVIFMPALEGVPWQSWGEALEHNPLFPNRTNVEFVEVLSRDRIKVKVWERGAGATLACGTGACAAVVAGVLTGRLGSAVRVDLPGGSLQINWEKDGKVYMEGPAEEVFSGRIETIKLLEEAR